MYKKPSIKTVVIALVAIITVSAVVGYLAIWVEGLPGPHHGAYLACASLHNIYQWLRDLDSQNSHLPPATNTENGKQSSWRIEVYQSCVSHDFMAAPKTNDNVLVDYDDRKAWNNPANLRLQEFGAWLFSYTQNDWDMQCHQGKAGDYATYYKAITGPDTAFDPLLSPPRLDELPKNLIIIMRVEQSDTHWMEPGDLSIEQLKPNDETKRLLLGKDGYVVLFADGQGWILSSKTPISELCKFFTISGAKQFSRDQILKPYLILPAGTIPDSMKERRGSPSKVNLGHEKGGMKRGHP